MICYLIVQGSTDCNISAVQQRDTMHINGLSCHPILLVTRITALTYNGIATKTILICFVYTEKKYLDYQSAKI